MHAKNFRGVRIVSVGLLDGALDQHLLRVANAIMQRAHRLAGRGGLFQNRVWQVIDQNQFGRAQHHGPLDGVLQFAHIARPVIALKAGTSLRRNAGHAPFHLLAILRRKKCRQQRNIFAPLPQRRHVERHDIEAIVKIGTKGSRTRCFFQIAIGSGNQPDIEFDGTRSAHPLKFPLLQNSQQLGLHGDGQLSDFIQKNRAALSHLKLSLFLRDGARESSSFMSEQFALQQGLSDGGAVNGDKRFVGAAAIGVNRSRHQFFSRAALARDQHCRVPPRHAGNKIIDFVHCLAFPDHAVVDVQFLVQAAVFPAQSLHVPGVLNRERCNISQRGHKFQKIRVEARARRTGVQVQHPQHFALHFERYGQHGVDLAFEQAVGLAVSIVALDIVRKHGEILLQHAVQDGLAGMNRLIGPEATMPAHD